MRSAKAGEKMMDSVQKAGGGVARRLAKHAGKELPEDDGDEDTIDGDPDEKSD